MTSVQSPHPSEAHFFECGNGTFALSRASQISAETVSPVGAEGFDDLRHTTIYFRVGLATGNTPSTLTRPAAIIPRVFFLGSTIR
jgi:hypothetical protein